MVPGERIELPTFGLQNRCSTAELTRRDSADQILRLIPKCNPQGSAIELLPNGSRFAILGISQTALGAPHHAREERMRLGMVSRAASQHDYAGQARAEPGVRVGLRACRCSSHRCGRTEDCHHWAC